MPQSAPAPRALATLAWMVRHRRASVAATLIAGAMCARCGSAGAAGGVSGGAPGYRHSRPVSFPTRSQHTGGGRRRKVIFDVGRGVYTRLNQVGIAFPDITGLLFTHLHSDHVSGLPDLWLTGRFAGKPPATNLEVWGPVANQGMIAHLIEAYQFDLTSRKHLPPTQGSLVPHEIAEGTVFSRNGVTVSAFLVDHGGVAPAFGYRIDYSGRSVVLSGDTRLSPHLIEKSVGVDLIVHEVAAVATAASTPDTQRIIGSPH